MFVAVEPGARHEIALVVVVELVDEERRRRIVADRDEEPVGGNLPRLVGDRAAQPQRLDLHVADDLVDDRVQDVVELLVPVGPVDHDPRRTELVAPVHQMHARRELGQEQRLLERGVAAADHVHVLVAEERRVAGRAGGDAAALVLLLGRDAEEARRRARGDDHRARGVLVVADVHAQGLLGEVDLRDVVGDELGAEPLGLPAEVGHHLRAP